MHNFASADFIKGRAFEKPQRYDACANSFHVYDENHCELYKGYPTFADAIMDSNAAKQEESAQRCLSIRLRRRK